ncbi:putative inactive histone-lysine N-methyltransferase [Nymphaea thermarum]|nr:putative inactive histone-lysine N-methyltransferase [Nymphaea thermarum]
MAPHSRFKSAVQAMRDIGIPSKTVKPVLRKLLELYDGNWALIEEESYRTLADAIFEQQDSDAVAIEEPPSALPSSSSMSCRESPSSSKRPMLEEPPPLRRRSQLRLEEPPSSPCQFSAPRLSKEPALEEEPLKRRSGLRSEKACGSPTVPPPTSPYVEASSFKRLASESAVSPHSRQNPVSVDGAANSNSFKRRKIEPSHVEPFPISSINDPIRCSHPNANGVLNDSGHATSPQRPSIPPVEDGNNPVQHSNHQNLQMPKLEPFVDDYPAVAVEVPLSVIHLSVMKLAEDRALKSYKILGSSFSIMKLMKEICQCFLELATGAGEQQKRITTVTPEINMSKLSKDHILAAAVVMNNIPQGATQVLVCGTITKTGYAVVRALCQRGTKVKSPFTFSSPSFTIVNFSMHICQTDVNSNNNLVDFFPIALLNS